MTDAVSDAFVLQRHSLRSVGIPKTYRNGRSPDWRLWFCSCRMWGDRWDDELTLEQIRQEHEEHVNLESGLRETIAETSRLAG